MHTLARLRNRIVSGFIFIMPVLITLVILGQFWKHLMRIGGGLSKLLKVDTVLGQAGDAVAAVLLFIVVCLVAGLLARISFLKRISEQIDERLDRLIPGYGQVRTATHEKIGVGKSDEHLFDTCLVRIGDLWQPGYVIESNVDGTQTVFVPQAPAVALGQVYIVEPERVRKLGIDFATLNARLKMLGKGIMGGAREAKATL